MEIQQNIQGVPLKNIALIWLELRETFFRIWQGNEGSGLITLYLYSDTLTSVSIYIGAFECPLRVTNSTQDVNFRSLFQKAPSIALDPEITFFNNNFVYERLPEYDLYFAYTKTWPLWDERKTKDNRRFLPDIRENIFEQVSENCGRYRQKGIPSNRYLNDSFKKRPFLLDIERIKLT